jgi:S-adenosylmethionine synthetase
MIEKVFKEREKYLWSLSSDGTVQVGGYINGQFYGLIEIKHEENVIRISFDESNGFQANGCTHNTSYNSNSREYDSTVDLLDEIKNYIGNPNTKMHQELNRNELLKNMLDLNN